MATAFGPYLRSLRKARGLSQRRLAERLGVSDRNFLYWERSSRVPSTARMAALADALELSTYERCKLIEAAGFRLSGSERP